MVRTLTLIGLWQYKIKNHFEIELPLVLVVGNNIFRKRRKHKNDS